VGGKNKQGASHWPPWGGNKKRLVSRKKVGGEPPKRDHWGGGGKRKMILLAPFEMEGGSTRFGKKLNVKSPGWAPPAQKRMGKKKFCAIVCWTGAQGRGGEEGKRRNDCKLGKKGPEKWGKKLGSGSKGRKIGCTYFPPAKVWEAGT